MIEKEIQELVQKSKNIANVTGDYSAHTSTLLELVVAILLDIRRTHRVAVATEESEGG